MVQATHPQAYEKGQKIVWRTKGPVPDSVLRPIRGLPLGRDIAEGLRDLLKSE